MDTLTNAPTKNLFLMVGLPRSGKSTIARTRNYPIVCPDEIRMAMYNRRFDPEQEAGVWWITRIMVRSLFSAGHTHVILDSCAITERRRKNWIHSDWITRYVHVSTTAEECIHRAERVGDAAIIPSIHRMSQEYQALSRDESFMYVNPTSDW